MGKIIKILKILFKGEEGYASMPKYPLVFDRFSVMEKYIRGKEVLDCGCVNHEIGNDKEWFERWLHKKIVEKSAYCLGIDIEKDEIKKLQSMGYNVEYANVETMHLNRKFDVIVAGELIEHLSNAGLFIDNANKHLRTDGILILTVPNCYNYDALLRVILGRQFNPNPQHTYRFHIVDLKQLLDRHGFTIKNIFLYQKPEIKLFEFLVKIRRDLASNLILIFQKR